MGVVPGTRYPVRGDRGFAYTLARGNPNRFRSGHHPCSPPAFAQVTRELDTPVQLGENFYGPRMLYQAVQAGAGDYVMPDLMRIGGVSGWLRAAAITGAAGIPMSTHLYPEMSAHLMRVTDTAHWLEWQGRTDPILAEPFKLDNGHLVVPDKPGQGVEWDEQAVARFAL